MHNTLRELCDEFRLKTGLEFDTQSFPVPGLVPKELISLVARIKICSATCRQIEIQMDVRKGQRIGDAYITSPELPHEFEQQKKEQELWTPYAV